ncbi:MAG TPA: helix-turn-helix domain-containing protein [Solirubrobacteraceae bacterium]|jgi:cytoskeletal protein RodZ|nr:helix-turn-helix domain-containing protein [Solirubrobacteraceae bacterium]
MAEIGSTLREARMRARIDISEVEAGTKIRAKYLRALENEEWDLLPGPVYVRSFLKTYGDYLGLDSRLLIDEFKRRYERPMEHEVMAMASTARERERHRDRHRSPNRIAGALLSPRSVIVVALVVIVVALYVIGSQTGGSNNSGNGNVATPPTTTTHHSTQTNTITRPQTTTTKTTNTTPPPTKATLSLVPTDTVWICVANQAGTPLITAKDYTAGETIPTLSAKALLITMGNTSVTMTANGKAYPLSGGNVTSLKVTDRGVTTLTTTPKGCD